MRYLSCLLLSFRSVFKRTPVFCWFVVLVIGFLIRNDFYGITSVVRVFSLPPGTYCLLLHFFHSSSFTVANLFLCWQTWVMQSKIRCIVNGRHVMILDHTNSVKDARKMPEVRTIHQDSETASKPSFFRGHKWACISLLAKSAIKCFSLPLWAEIHPSDSKESMAIRPVSKAVELARHFSIASYLVVDAFFAVGPVFLKAYESKGQLHIVTRAKKNIVAFTAPPEKTGKRGAPRKYGKKIKLTRLFERNIKNFRTIKTNIYDRTETIKYLVMDLIWKPVKRTLRFFLVKSSRGRIIIMSSDLEMNVQTACLLYCRRATIETFFNVLKNLLGGMRYHFWSKYLQSISRKPKKNETAPVSSNPVKTGVTLAAIEKYMALHVIVVGIIQLLAVKAPKEMISKAKCWQRTVGSREHPSPFVVVAAMKNIFTGLFNGFGKNWMSAIIHCKQKNSPIPRKYRIAA